MYTTGTTPGVLGCALSDPHLRWTAVALNRRCLTTRYQKEHGALQIFVFLQPQDLKPSCTEHVTRQDIVSLITYTGLKAG